MLPGLGTTTHIANKLGPDNLDGDTRELLLQELLTSMAPHIDPTKLDETIIDKLDTRASKLETELKTYIQGTLDYCIPELTAGLISLTNHQGCRREEESSGKGSRQ
jgi:hypothetical protein